MVTFEDLVQSRVKLEFGNEEQIAVIDVMQAKKEAAEQAEKDLIEGKLKEFRVELTKTSTCVVFIKAYNQGQADEVAEEEAADGEWEDEEVEVVHIEETS